MPAACTFGGTCGTHIRTDRRATARPAHQTRGCAAEPLPRLSGVLPRGGGHRRLGAGGALGRLRRDPRRPRGRPLRGARATQLPDRRRGARTRSGRPARRQVRQEENLWRKGFWSCTPGSSAPRCWPTRAASTGTSSSMSSRTTGSGASRRVSPTASWCTTTTAPRTGFAPTTSPCSACAARTTRSIPPSSTATACSPNCPLRIKRSCASPTSSPRSTPSPRPATAA